MRDIISMNEVDTQRENDGYGELLAGIRQEFSSGWRLMASRRRPASTTTAMPAGISSTGMVGWSKLTRRPESRHR